MMVEIIEQPRCDYYRYGVSYASHLGEELGGISVNKVNSDSTRMGWRNGLGGAGEGGREGRITWISPFNGRNQLRDFTMAYWNDVSVGYIYCSPCLIARVSPASDRA